MEIKYNNVGFSYKEKEKQENVVLADINLEIKEGLSLVVGKSGSGKTTMIEMMNALLMPSKGEIYVAEFVIKKAKKINNVNNLRKKVGLVFQFPEDQIFEKTVLKEITFGLKFLNVKKTKEEVIEVLEEVGLDETYLGLNPLFLSNGEKRKVALASVLISDPEILIFDEPSVGLDKIGINSLIKVITKYKKEGKKVIIISHDVDLWFEQADNIIALNNGKLIINEKKEEAFKDINYMKENNIFIPKVIEFLDIVKKEKGIDLGFHDNLMDLMKAVYRSVK